MALRSLDNALPIAQEGRPKKIAKTVAAVAAIPRDSPANDKNALAPTPPLRKAVISRDSPVNDENTPPTPLRKAVIPRDFHANGENAVLTKAAEATVEYIASVDLKPMSDPETKITSLLEELDSKDWTKMCVALNDVRRFALYHSSHLLPILDKVMLVMVKAMKNPRSALCKTSIMASSDIFHSFGHVLLSTSGEDAFDNLLLQLLLKASQDKRFVCEEAERALQQMICFIPPLPLLKKVRSYVKHTNLKVRAKAAVSISNCVSRMGTEVMKEFGLADVLHVAAELLNDRLPEARESARSIANMVYQVFSGMEEPQDNGSTPAADSWQNFCSSNLPPISAQSVAKIISQQ